MDGESSAAQRRNLTADHVTQDERGIEDLIKVELHVSCFFMVFD